MSVVVPVALDLEATFMLHQFGRFDPTATVDSARLTKAFVQQGATCTVTLVRAGDSVTVSAEGPTGAALEAQLARWLAADDGVFEPTHPLVSTLHGANPGLRLVRVPWLEDIAFSAILQQRVRTLDAMSQWAAIARTLGTNAPGGLKAFPSPAQLAATPSFRLEALGVDPKRARAMLLLARELKLHPLRADHTLEHLRARLDRVPGVGPWTIDMVMGFGAGDPDAVPVGDLHLPRIVCESLAGERRGADARMLELLEPMRGHRFRVIRLLYGSVFRTRPD
jgi:3-methyladenine DNA glycosylase/8-oxoguanine DNA glycosylase